MPLGVSAARMTHCATHWAPPAPTVRIMHRSAHHWPFERIRGKRIHLVQGSLLVTAALVVMVAHLEDAAESRVCGTRSPPPPTASGPPRNGRVCVGPPRRHRSKLAHPRTRPQYRSSMVFALLTGAKEAAMQRLVPTAHGEHGFEAQVSVPDFVFARAGGSGCWFF